MRKPSLTKTIAIRGLLGCLISSAAGGLAVVASAQTSQTIRVVCYNIQDDTTLDGCQGTIALSVPSTA